MKEVSINGELYQVNDNEFNLKIHEVYNYLKIIDKLGEFERLISFINYLEGCKDSTFTDAVDRRQGTVDSILFCNTTHGGFIPIQCSKNFKKIYLTHTDLKQTKNILTNISKYKTHNVSVINYSAMRTIPLITVDLNGDNSNSYKSTYVISSKSVKLGGYTKYDWANANLFIYVKSKANKLFTDRFCYYLENTKLTYDNLNHLCIMVKNGGPQFEQMLIDNINYFDRWTILDTGSTDNTIEIINKVLVGKKDGKLYKEPFINFRDSRNRLLDLAGKECKFITMLDDTYVIDGDLREFLNVVRGDQYADSFTLFIESDDTSYGSNRVIKSAKGLRYIHKIHEVISDKDNVNVVIPKEVCQIVDRRFDYMEERTMERKQLDLKLLYEEVEDNPNNPRSYYYLAQTYNLLEDYEKAFYYFNKRCEYINSGFLQERVDAAFEAARIANFKLNKPWEECLSLYERAYKIDESRPESLYFIGIHYYLEGDYDKAHSYFKKGFEVGYPTHCQYSLKPTLSFHFLPKFLTRVCYTLEDYQLGERASKFFLENNTQDADDYAEIASWYAIFQKLNMYKGPRVPKVPKKPIICFVADGGFHPWTGSDIKKKGIGGSETYIIEIARYLKKLTEYDVYVFCNTPNQQDEDFEGVMYRHLNKYYEFINTTYVHTCIVSRFSEYLPLTFKGFSENVYLVLHDLTPSGVIVPMDNKLKNIFCLTEWHVEYFTSIFPQLKSRTVPFYYGIDDTLFNGNSQVQKVPYKFIYSSFPNRGLLELLLMWPKIIQMKPEATLHIYSNVDHPWSNSVEPEKMAKIKGLLKEYSHMNIYYHGWVSKKDLTTAWETADIWFYPCTFMETFCLTALEAAKSKTLVITNDLAALQNTVGDRGLVIKGDPTTENWQKEALNVIGNVLNGQFQQTKMELIKKNFEWANNLSWKNQANKLFNEYLSIHQLEYKGMYNWTNDLPVGGKQIFENVLAYFNQNYPKVKRGETVKVLEVGSYTGISLINIIKRIPNSVGIGLDKWESYNENELLECLDGLEVEKSFYSNIKKENLEDRISGIKSDSLSVLIDFVKEKKRFDLIYVDGSHLLLDCYADLVLSWDLLEKGGILIIDDYLYKKDSTLDSPYEGVNHFLKNLKQDSYRILDKSYRVFLEKL